VALPLSSSEEIGTRQSLRAFRAGYWFGGFNGLTWMMGLGTPMVLLIEQLGGSTFQVGLAASFVLLLFPVQVLATAALATLGFRRQMVLAWSARALFLLVPLALAWLAPEEPAAWMPGAVVASVFGFCAFRAMGVAAHIPWFAAILPDELRGRFFATDASITSSVGVATLLCCAGLFAQLPTYRAFQAAYGIAVTGSALAVWNLLRLPAGPKPRESPFRHMAPEVVRLSTRPGLFRQYLVVSLLWLLATLPVPAFAAYYLKVAAGVPSSAILAYTAVQFVGQLAGAWSIRHWIDRVAIRRFFQLASGVVILVSLLWLGILSGDGAGIAALWLVYALFGVAIGLSQAAHFTYLPELSVPEKRPVTIAIFGAVVGVLSGLAPTLWGLALRSGAGAPGIDEPTFALFFAAAIAMCALGIWLLNSLPEVRSSLSAGRH
jgi:MFS family permease